MPTAAGITAVLSKLQNRDILWINLREEPIVYINGSPYRREQFPFGTRNCHRTLALIDQVRVAKRRAADAEHRFVHRHRQFATGANGRATEGGRAGGSEDVQGPGEEST